MQPLSKNASSVTKSVEQVFKRHFAAILADCASFTAAVLVSILAAHLAQAQAYRYNSENRRSLDSTIHHLQELASHNSYSGREQKRYDHALTHISQFAGRLERGVFDKQKLNEGIADLRNIISNNPMDDRARATLSRDLADLRSWRASYQSAHHHHHR